MSLSLIAAIILQATAPSEWGLVCLSDPRTGAVDVTQSRLGADGVLEANVDGKWIPARLEDRPQAAGLAWYKTGDPIVREGVRYTRDREGRTWSPGGAVGRYFRHVGLHDGAPLFSVWPGGDIDLAVLVHQQECEFAIYSPEPGVRTEP
jgi:hypothetical protein